MTGMVKKSKAWAKHGRHGGLLGIAIQLNRVAARKGKPPLRRYATVQELMEMERTYRKGNTPTAPDISGADK